MNRFGGCARHRFGVPPGDHPLTPDLFERIDEGDDAVFFAAGPEREEFIGEEVRIVERFLLEVLPRGGDVLELFARSRSPVSPLLEPRRLVGLGLLEAELAENPGLTEWVVHDLNRCPELPFADSSFDAAFLSGRLPYLVHPVEAFRSVRRVLRPGAPFVVFLSERFVLQKAVRIWRQSSDPRERMELGMAYFRFAGGFAGVAGIDLRPGVGRGEGRVLAVIGHREKQARPVPASPGWRRR